MPKDNEIIHLPFDGPVLPSEPAGFSVEQMIRCEECLRANPPTRVNCLYCSASLPLTESTAKLRKPILRQPEKHELGYNTIVLRDKQGPSANLFEDSAELLKLDVEICERIVSAAIPLPLARTASRDEAELVYERLKELGLSTMTLPDDVLGFGEDSLVRARAMQWDDETLRIYQAGGRDVCEVVWPDLLLLVSGRMILKKVEVVERISRRTEKEILNTSQFFTDEAVLDLYSTSLAQTFRIVANSFDFSCLGERKALVAGQNLMKLRELIISKATKLSIDDSYNELRPLLEAVWRTEQETQSRGWRRVRPGKYSLGEATVNSNETQFHRYSRLRRYFVLNPAG